MERPLTAALDDLEAGYRAALWKRSLARSGIATRGQFWAWRDAQPVNTRDAHNRRLELANAFLDGAPVDQVEDIYAMRRDALLREDGAVLYAIDVIRGFAPMPRDGRLVEHVVWVKQFVTRVRR